MWFSRTFPIAVRLNVHYCNHLNQTKTTEVENEPTESSQNISSLVISRAIHNRVVSLGQHAQRWRKWHPTVLKRDLEGQLWAVSRWNSHWCRSNRGDCNIHVRRRGQSNGNRNLEGQWKRHSFHVDW